MRISEFAKAIEKERNKYRKLLIELEEEKDKVAQLEEENSQLKEEIEELKREIEDYEENPCPYDPYADRGIRESDFY